jgi:hypothetical protein
MVNPPFSLKDYLESLGAPHSQTDNPLVLAAAYQFIQDNPNTSVREFFKMEEKNA